jgi:TolB-like protein/Tfp pilus assembly protein PilF
MDTIAHYNILEKIGTGGMGEVYRARDTKLGRTVAIKVLPPELARDPGRRERLLREARASAAISHPNIATLFQVGEEGGTIFLVFEYVPGQTLHAAIGGRPMNTRRAIDLAIQLADAVADAHAAGVIHRDIKPDNIIVTPKGNAKILDFGLAAWTQGGAARADVTKTTQTKPGMVMGTLAYLSPEQARGEMLDERTDIFSLGIVIFEMLTGRNPFMKTGGGLSAVASILRDEAPAPSSVSSGLPREIDAMLARALAKKPDDRYASAVTLAAELRAVGAILDVRSGASEPIAMTPPAPAPRIRWGWVAALALLALAAAGAWLGHDAAWRMWRRYVEPPPEPIIAVLPFEVADPSSTYFADGLADDLITRLGQTPGLKVIGRSATREYRGASPSKIAGDLGARVVLTGSVRREAGTLRVTIELVDPSDGVQIWSDQFDRPIEHVFAIQTDIAERVARALRVKLDPSAVRARTTARLVDARAYDLYLRARDALARRDRVRAVELYEQAVAADPNLAEAHAELAAAIYLEAVGGGDFYDAAFLDRARRSATNAVNLDPDLPQALLAMGLASPGLTDAIDYLTRAIANDPTYAEAYHELGDLVASIDPARAVPLYRKALDLDPRLDVNWADLATVHLSLDQADAVRDVAAKSAVAAPRSPGALIAGALASLAVGDVAPMLAVARQAVDATRGQRAPAVTLLLVRALYLAGREEEARGTIRDLVATAPEFCEGQALQAGALTDAARRAEARPIADAVLSWASAADAPPQLARCAANATAALGDAAATAGWLARIAANENRLRWWGLTTAGPSADLQVKLRLYPWQKVADSPEVRAALVEIEKARARLRPAVAAALAAVPQ